MTRCTYWRRYKGTHAPRCNGGTGCEHCKAVWRRADAERKNHVPAYHKGN